MYVACMLVLYLFDVDMFHCMYRGMLVLYMFDVDMLRVTFVYLIFVTSVVEVSAVSLHGPLVNIY